VDELGLAQSVEVGDLGVDLSTEFRTANGRVFAVGVVRGVRTEDSSSRSSNCAVVSISRAARSTSDGRPGRSRLAAEQEVDR